MRYSVTAALSVSTSKMSTRADTDISGGEASSSNRMLHTSIHRIQAALSTYMFNVSIVLYLIDANIHTPNYSICLVLCHESAEMEVF